jgi:hypothetical protein
LTTIYKNNENFGDNMKKKIGFFSLSWSVHLAQVSGKGIFFFHLLSILLISHVWIALDSQDRTVRTGQSGQDSQCRISRTGLLGHGMKDKIDWTGQ